VINSPVSTVKVGVLLDGDADYVSLRLRLFATSKSLLDSDSTLTNRSLPERIRVKVDKEDDVPP
jgi:hypothetical protein